MTLVNSLANRISISSTANCFGFLRGNLHESRSSSCHAALDAQFGMLNPGFGVSLNKKTLPAVLLRIESVSRDAFSH